MSEQQKDPSFAGAVSSTLWNPAGEEARREAARERQLRRVEHVARHGVPDEVYQRLLSTEPWALRVAQCEGADEALRTAASRLRLLGSSKLVASSVADLLEAMRAEFMPKGSAE